MKHRLKEDNMHSNLEMQTKSELLRLVENQELAWKCAQDAVENLDRRLKLLEDGWVKFKELVEKNVEHSLMRLEECSHDEDAIDHYSHIYFSPLFEGREREPVREHPRQQQNNSGSMIGKQYTEILDLEAEIGGHALFLSECQQRKKTKMLCDKANSNWVLLSMASNYDKKPVLKLLGDLHIVQQTVLMLSSICQNQKKRLPLYKLGDLNVEVENVDLWVFLEFCMNLVCQMAKYLDGFSQELLLYFVDGDTYSWSKQLPATIQELGNLKLSLKAAIRQLEMEEMKNKLVVENVTDEEKSHAEVVEYVLELERKEKLLSSAQQLNIQLTNGISESEATLTEWRSHFKGLIASLRSQLKDAHGDRAVRQKIADRLMQDLAKREEKAMYLERVLGGKDKQIEEVRKRMQAIQNETDLTVMEKYQLINSIQEIEKESWEQSYRITELVGINEELSHFAEMKENQLASLGKEAARLQELCQETSGENVKLIQELETRRKLLEGLKERVGTLKCRYKFVESRLCNAEFELLQREATLERLTKHLAMTVQDYFCVVEETQQIHPSSRMTRKQVQKLGNQLKHAQTILVEQKLVSEQVESSIVRNKMTKMMAKLVMIQKRKGERRLKALCWP